jgi:hypothetical protein
MKGFLKALILIPIAAVVTLFAVAHRDPVTVTWNPLDKEDPTYQLTVPLFALLFAALAIGILLGGLGTWLAQGRYRKAARQQARLVDMHRREIDRLRSDAELPALPPPSMVR